MAGTAYAAAIDETQGWDLGGDFIGNANGAGGHGWNQWHEGTGSTDNGQPDWHEAFIDQFPADGATRTADGGGNPKSAASAVAAVDEADGTSLALDWFEKTHILPRTKIEFGDILTLEEEEYEIFNAFRDTTVTINSVINNALPGINLPNMAAPLAQDALGSWLDPTSTGNSGTSGLGTLVKLKVQALAEGLSQFDSNIVFGFDVADDVELEVSGQRIVLLPMEYEAPTKETLAFLTDIIGAIDGAEQRIALRKNPRQVFEVLYRLDQNDRQRMQALLMGGQANVFGFPLWHEKLTLTSAVSIGATMYQVSGADEVDLRVGGLAVVFTDANTYDVINISALTSSQITASDPSLNAYPAGTTIMPLRTVFIRGAVAGRRYTNNLEDFRVTVEVLDNDTGALTGDTSAYSTYNSRVLFDGCNVVEGDNMPIEHRQRVYLIDNQTGKVDVSTLWDRSKRLHQKGFVLRDRSEILAFRRLMIALRGRQKAFYIPTFIEDVNVVAQLDIGTDTMDIENIEYVRFVQSRLPKSIMRVTFTDGTSLIRTVQSAVTVSSTVERLTVDSNWPASRPVAEIDRVEFYELVRFDSDNVNIDYPRIGLGTCKMPVLQVFDDNA